MKNVHRRKLFARLNRKNQRRKGRRSNLRFESLESRTLLAADLGIGGEESLWDASWQDPAQQDVFDPSLMAEGEAGDVAEGESGEILTLGDFAQALTDANVRFFGTESCIHCQRQKELFGDDADLLPYIETTAAVADANEITSVPTWIFQDGTRALGYQPLGELSRLSGIALPPNHVSFVTNAGTIDLLLLPGEAPDTVANFLRYVNQDPNETTGNNNSLIGTIFHRSDDDFVLQGAGFKPPSLTTTDVNDIADNHIDTFDPIGDERGPNSRSNTYGTVTMAKSPLGATSEWFVNLNDNTFLDSQGFTVFGLALGIAEADGSPNPDAGVNRIVALQDVDIDPHPTRFVFDNVPYTSQNELVVIEALEGSGTVSGITFNDLDGDGTRVSGEPGLSGFTVYSDANNDGVLNDGELSTITGADGSYTLVLPHGAHTIRQEPVGDFGQTVPADAYNVDIEVGDVLTGGDFGNLQVAAPTGIDLLAATDSGIDDDNRTNFDNSTTATSLQFTVSGVEVGALVRIFADGIKIGEATATATEFTMVTDGVSVLNDDPHNIVATQEIDGVQGPASPSLTINIDTEVPVFTSTLSEATVGVAVDYNAENPEEQTNGALYSLVGAPGNVNINPVTGTLAWTPTSGQVGVQQFDIVLTDGAGNTGVQSLSVDVSNVILTQARLEIVDTNLSPVSILSVGDTFILRAYVEDLRGTADGVFSFYHDVVFDANLANVNSITHSTPYGNAASPPGGIVTTPGLLDDIGSFSGSLNPLGPGEFLLYEVEFTALRSGTLNFVGDAPDVLPAHAIGLYFGPTDGVPLDQIEFGQTSVTIDPTFGANNDVFNFDEDTSDNAMDVLANDLSETGAELTISGVGTTVNRGTVTIAGDNKSLLYTPAPDFFGEDSFTYDVTDGNDTLQASVVVQVFPTNDDPLAVNDAFTVDEDANNNFFSVLDNDLITPDANENLEVSAVEQPTNGGTAVRGTSGSHILYTPAANFSGTDTFTYTISDGNGGTSEATVTVTVNPGNDDPTPIADTFTVDEDSTDNVFDVLVNDSSAPDEGETLTLSEVGTPNQGGTAEIGIDGKIHYTPAENNFGEESFTYTISDGNGGSASTQVLVNVTGSNDPPTANDDDLTVTMDTTGNLLDVLANDTILPDADETLTILTVNDSAQGVALSISDGKIVYTPPADFEGDDTFSYTIGDGSGLTAEAQVTVHVVEFVPGSISGFVYIDGNNDGLFDSATELPMEGVTITLEGTDDFGGTVSRSVQSGQDGSYAFNDLPPGTYTVAESQPSGEIDGLPIVDGRDSIGSQGGTDSVNDEFTIVLAEGVDGTDNNFAELLGRSLGGIVRAVGSESNQVLFTGIDVELLGASLVDARLATTNKTDGEFAFAGLTPSTYELTVSSQPFLLPSTSVVPATIQTTDSLDNTVTQRGLRAEFITHSFFTNLTPTQDFLYASTNGGTDADWLAGDAGWLGFLDLDVTYSDAEEAVVIEAVDTAGNTHTKTVPTNDPRVENLGRDSGHQLFRLLGAARAFDLVPQPADNGASEGETGEGEEAAAAAQNVALASPPAIQPVVFDTVNIATTAATQTPTALEAVTGAATTLAPAPATTQPELGLQTTASVSEQRTTQVALPSALTFSTLAPEAASDAEGEGDLSQEVRGELLELVAQETQDAATVAALADAIAEESQDADREQAVDQALVDLLDDLSLFDLV